MVRATSGSSFEPNSPRVLLKALEAEKHLLKCCEWLTVNR